MKRIVMFALAVMMLLPQTSHAKKKSGVQNELKVMSYNIRVDDMKKMKDGM